MLPAPSLVSPQLTGPQDLVESSIYSHEQICNLVGTLAAGAQAGIGNVVAGSVFATAQSVAMGGALPGVITAAGAGIAGVAGAAIAAVL